MTVDLTRLVKPLVWVPTRVRRKHLVEGEEVIELRAKGPFLYTLSKNYQIGFSWSAFWGRNSPIDNGICVTLAAAQAAANADNAARVLAAIDTALIAELVEALRAIAETSNYTRASWMQDTARAALTKLKGPQA